MDIDIPRLRKILRDTRHQVFDDDHLREWWGISQQWAASRDLSPNLDVEKLVSWHVVSNVSWEAALEGEADDVSWDYHDYIWIHDWAMSEIRKVIGPY